MIIKHLIQHKKSFFTSVEKKGIDFDRKTGNIVVDNRVFDGRPEMFELIFYNL